MRGKNKRLAKFLFMSIFLALVMRMTSFSGQLPLHEQESQVEDILARADSLYQAGDYRKAIESYLEASQLAERRINLSRAYFGLSLSYFYLRDTANSKKWVQRLLYIDPKREISSLFCSESFVHLFAEVQREISEEEQKTGVQGQSQTRNPSIPSSPERTPAQQTLPGEFLPGKTEWGGKWEIEVHYSAWSVNIIKGTFEDFVTKKLGAEVRNEVAKQIKESHPSVASSEYEQSFVFDSGGSNYGLELRFYPGGRDGAFSLGLTFEKTTIDLKINGSAKQIFANGTYATVDADAYLTMRPFSTNLNFRWDFVPSWRVTPYFVFGIGVAPLNGEFGYNYSGLYHWSGIQETVEDSNIKTIKEFEEDVDFNIPNIIPIIQASFGVRGEITKGLMLRAEGGFWNGIVLRGGLAYRF